MIYILGRQPKIGLAELESLYGAEYLRPLGEEAVLVENTDEVNFERIGGSIKAAKLLTILKTSDINKVHSHLKDIVVENLALFPESKLKLGLSTYGFKVHPAKLNAIGLDLKKIIKNSGQSVRLVPNKENHLSSAQVLHNKLTGDLGCEILLIKDDLNTIIAQTTNVQNIESYTLRDRGRPKRDARVGMLPPKLAQTIINLSSSGFISAGDTKGETQARYTSENRAAVVSIADNKARRLLDPFCGTGVILQEAALMGYSVYGTDLDERMIRNSRDNVNWLTTTYDIRFDWYLHEGDATDTKWQQPLDIVASEVYLGRPFTSAPDKAILQKTINDCDTIVSKFLKNLASQSDSGLRACLAVPAWFVDGKIYHLKTLDHLGDLGYNRISFVHAGHEDLIYHREGQIVGRELLVISRK